MRIIVITSQVDTRALLAFAELTSGTVLAVSFLPYISRTKGLLKKLTGRIVPRCQLWCSVGFEAW